MSWAPLGQDQDASPPGKILVSIVSQPYRDSSYLTAFIYIKKQFPLFCGWHQELHTSDFCKKNIVSLTQLEWGYLSLFPTLFSSFSLTAFASLQFSTNG